MSKMPITDPIELSVARGLEQARIEYISPCPETNLDFLLVESGVRVEVKQFHSDRISEQMSRAENVIVIQGKKDAELFTLLINGEK